MRATSLSQNEKISFSSLITFGIATFVKSSLYSCLLVYLHLRTWLSSWGKVLVGYGSLLATLYFGEYSGQIMANNCYTNLSNGFYSTIFLILSSSYITVAFVSRFFIFLLLFWVIGFTSLILSVFSLNIDSRFSLIQFQRKSTLPEARDPKRKVEWLIVCFIFFAFVTYFLYDHQPHVGFPCYYLSLLLALSCCAMLIYYCIWQQTIRMKKSILSAKLTPTSYASYNANSHAGSGRVYDHATELQPATECTEVSPTEADLAHAGDVPVNFLNCCSGDINKARQMYAKMIAWRRKFNIDKIFQTPQHRFESITRFYPHAIHGYSKDGCGVVYEVLGKGKPKELTESGVSIDDIVWHFNLRNEVVFRYVLAPERLQEAVNQSPPGAIQITPFLSPYSNHPNAMNQLVPRLMTVIDLQGISMSSFSLHVISFLKKSSDTVDNFYPEQVARLVICNAPTWFSLLWIPIKKVLTEAVRNKVDICHDCSSLDKFIHPSQRPKEYGGTDVALGESEGHKYFLSLAEKWKESATTKNTEEKSSDRKGNSINEATRSSNQPSDQGCGNRNMFTWIYHRFRRVPLANLGFKNTYKFNGQTEKWETEVNEENTSLLAEEVPNDGKYAPD